jgi:ABC-type glycerol-3-phosphate transport system permease component
MMVPGELLMAPLYLMFSQIGWTNTFKVLILPGTANVLALFMMRQYLNTVPNAIVEAAKIDGAGYFRIFYRIILNMMLPVIGALSILVALGKWNDYVYPRIMISSTRVMPIMVILPTLNETSSSWSVPWNLVLTGCSIVITPIIILFLIFQDTFISSVSIGAVKE